MTITNLTYIKKATDVIGGPSYWYVATPYSKYPLGVEAAFKDACTAAALLMRVGVKVFSPIAHSHPIAETGLVANNLETWLAADTPLLDAAAGVIVVQMEGWRESSGIAYEIKHTLKAGKPVFMATWE